MTFTRSPDFPEEDANLAGAMARCANGATANVVINATCQILASAITQACQMNGASLDETIAIFQSDIADGICEIIRHGWNRTPQPDDIPVRVQ